MSGRSCIPPLFKKELSEDNIVNIVENLFFLFFSIKESRSKKQALSILILYFKTHYNNSIVLGLKDFLVDNDFFTSDEIVDVEIETETKPNVEHDIFNGPSIRGHLDFDHQSSTQPTWLTTLKNCHKNWSLAKSVPAFSKVSKLISMLAALGLCELSHFNVDFNGVRIFSIGAYSKHVSAPDLMSALLDTVVYFAEGAYKFFETGDITTFLYTDSDAMQFEENYFKICEMSNFVRCGNLSKFENGQATEKEYDLLLVKTIESGQAILRGLSGPEKTIMSTKFEKLRKLRADFVQYRTSGQLRIAPFGLYIHGASAVGKSYVSALLMRLLLKMNDFDCSDERLMTLNPSDKFMSNAKSFVNGIFLDDVGNTKPDFCEEAFTQRMIDLINNIPYYANMAELDQKGKLALEPNVVVMTSNLMLDRLARIYSNDVMSIIRRCNIHLTVYVKPEYCIHGNQLNSEKVRNDFGSDPYPNVWEFDCFIADNTDDPKGELKKLFDERISLVEVIALLQEHSARHFKNQAVVVENSKNLGEKLELCPLCSLPTPMCKCCQFGINLPAEIKKSVDWILDHRILNVLYIFQDNQIYSKHVSTIIAFLKRKDRWEGPDTFRSFGHCSLLFALLWYLLFSVVNFVWFVSAIYFYLSSFYVFYKSKLIAISEFHGTVKYVFKSVRSQRAKKFFASCVVVAIAYKLIKRYRAFLQFQGNLLNPSAEEVDIRDKEANPWVGAYVQPVPQNLHIQCSKEQLINNVESNLCYLRLPHHPDGVAFCDIFFLKSNIAVIPQHMWHAEDMRYEVYHTQRVVANGDTAPHKRGHGILSRLHSYHIPGTDLCIVYIPGCGTWRDLTRFLPDSKIGDTHATMIYRRNEGTTVRLSTYMKKSDIVKVKNLEYSGHTYVLPIDTFCGLCMGTLISDTKPSLIAGFHLAGNGKHGASGFLTKNMVGSACSQLSKINSILLPHSDGNFPEKQCGVKLLDSTSVHQNSCVNYIPVDSVFNVYGSCPGRATYRSEVVKLPISDDITKVCGVPCLWGKPKMHPWKPFYVNLQNTSNPSLGFPAQALEWAVNDWLEPMLKLIKQKPWNKSVRPLTEVETVSGIDGQRFMNAMVGSTSIGVPLSGPKKNHMLALNPDDHPGHACPMVFDETIMTEVARLKAAYLSGERGYFILKASPKDEATKLDKDKVRIFFGCPGAALYILRQYLLSIIRFICMNPLVAECAVGINSHGPEWDQLAKHVTKYGKDRILAGDYKAYDTRMSSQLTLATYNMYVKIAEASGNYTQDDITIMKGAITDSCYPFISFNGDLISLHDLHISGTPITAVAGSGANSLMQRCAYYTVTQQENKKLEKFRDIASIQTFGDDTEGSVAKRAEHFNFISLQNFLADSGIEFTMPDKKSAPKKFLHIDETDFLKRRNVYCEELDQIMGALDKQSIFKSLHCVLKSKHVTTIQQAQMNIDGAIREIFLHGRDEYETLRAQLKEVATRNDVHGCLMLDVSYDEHMQNYKEKYYGAEPETKEVEEIFDFTFQSGTERYLSPKEYSRSRYVAKRATQRESDRKKGCIFEYEDETVKIVRRHHASNTIRGVEELPSFFAMKKNQRTTNFFDLLRIMPHKPCFYESEMTAPGHLPLGDIDLGFFVGGDREFAIFEMKKTLHKGCSAKNRRQVEAMVRHLSRYNRDATFHGFLARGTKIHHVASSGEPCKKVRKMELFLRCYSGVIL